MDHVHAGCVQVARCGLLFEGMHACCSACHVQMARFKMLVQCYNAMAGNMSVMQGNLPLRHLVGCVAAPPAIRRQVIVRWEAEQ